MTSSTQPLKSHNCSETTLKLEVKINTHCCKYLRATMPNYTKKLSAGLREFYCNSNSLKKCEVTCQLAHYTYHRIKA